MAKIPEYQGGIIPSMAGAPKLQLPLANQPSGGVPAVGDVTTAGLAFAGAGENLKKAGKTLGELAAAKKTADEIELVYAALNTASKDMTDQALAAKSVEEFNTNSVKIMSAAMTTMPSQEARVRLQYYLNRHHLTLLQNTQYRLFREDISAKQSVTMESLSTLVHNINDVFNTNLYPTVDSQVTALNNLMERGFAEIDDKAKAGILPPDRVPDLKKAFRENIYVNYVHRRLLLDPTGVHRELIDGKWNNLLEPKSINTLLEKSESRLNYLINQNEAAQRHVEQLTDKYDSDMYQHYLGRLLELDAQRKNPAGLIKEIKESALPDKYKNQLLRIAQSEQSAQINEGLNFLAKAFDLEFSPEILMARSANLPGIRAEIQLELNQMQNEFRQRALNGSDVGILKMIYAEKLRSKAEGLFGGGRYPMPSDYRLDPNNADEVRAYINVVSRMSGKEMSHDEAELKINMANNRLKYLRSLELKTKRSSEGLRKTNEPETGKSSEELNKTMPERMEFYP